ncbi:ras-related and estrogen-regulated growth inhibitor-like protein [Lingula anatina]|uniref:small monomeric GTPase n=1 Tax=Lingula anatina TaxID=7574 RepID=A0A1S3KCH5_LINAN|nr:ras-related and estrogen-regulated growth inhibitor-like protein [Lingula anatina]|eukprot:XP_013420139.1 ras-related and estrogen-regulated growth inhibitor-like protein [Lingula anatina]
MKSEKLPMTTEMTGGQTTVRVAVLGSPRAGKSAVTVRFLTKRFIGEYNSSEDMVYRHNTKIDENQVDIEVMDCSCPENQSLPIPETLAVWADAFVVVYSICDRSSFQEAKRLICTVQKLKSPSYVPVMLIANKTDLDHRREVEVEEGQELSLEYGCRFHEVSAADCYISVHIAFTGLMKEIVTMVQNQKLNSLKRRKSSLYSVSKAIQSMFGKNLVKRKPSI